MYIYESHMGGLYTSDEPIDYDDLYCETCGDSDMELFEAETMTEAWNYFKDEVSLFDPYRCVGCPKADQEDGIYEPADDACADCDNYKAQYCDGHGYSFPYIMEFLEESFEFDHKPIYVLTVMKHNGCILATMEDRSILPPVFCIDSQYVNLGVRHYGLYDSEFMELPELVRKRDFRDKIIYYYVAEDVSDKIQDEISEYAGDDLGWIGYCRYEDLSEKSKSLLEPIKNIIQIN